jgi:hypothetical protein
MGGLPCGDKEEKTIQKANYKIPELEKVDFDDQKQNQISMIDDDKSQQ